MTRDEFTAVMGLVKASWPHGSSEDLSRGYWEYLAELEVDDVARAVRDLALSGREFPPPPGVVHAAVHHGADRKPVQVADARAKDRIARGLPRNPSGTRRRAIDVARGALPRARPSTTDPLDTLDA